MFPIAPPTILRWYAGALRERWYMDPVDKLKMVFGFMLLLGLLSLATLFAVGKVEEKTSFGLMPIVTTLSTLAGLFGGWAFREKRPSDAPPPPEPPPKVNTGENL